MALTLAALFPRRYRVDRTIIRRSAPHEFDEPLSVEAYFQKSANIKYRYIVCASVAFFGGVVGAVFSIL